VTHENLLPQVYHELRKLAHAKLACENPHPKLNATALVHEAFLKLGGEAARDRGARTTSLFRPS
jgi:hypothetical protein